MSDASPWLGRGDCASRSAEQRLGAEEEVLPVRRVETVLKLS